MLFSPHRPTTLLLLANFNLELRSHLVQVKIVELPKFACFEMEADSNQDITTATISPWMQMAALKITQVVCIGVLIPLLGRMVHTHSH